MFDEPDAKRVRREDIADALSPGWHDESGDEGVDEELHARLGKALGLNLGAFSPKPKRKNAGADDRAVHYRNTEDEETRGENDAEGSQCEDLGEFEFRLFSTAGSKARVVLQSESEAHGEGAIVARRPPSYYLVPRPSAKLKRQYEFAALSGEEVLARSTQRSWGLELPWKVTRIAATTAGAKLAATKRSEPAGRRRPGKKTRIALRGRERAQKLAEAQATEKLVAKEEHLMEKKKRLNRSKKLRRRAKEREKKMAGGADGGEGIEAGDSG